MKKFLLMALVTAPVIAMESVQEQSAFRLENSDAATAEEFGNNKAFTLVTQKRMLEIMRINFKSALKVLPKVDKDKVKALKEEIKKANAEIRKIDNLIKQQGEKAGPGFAKRTKESIQDQDAKGKEEVK